MRWSYPSYSVFELVGYLVKPVLGHVEDDRAYMDFEDTLVVIVA